VIAAVRDSPVSRDISRASFSASGFFILRGIDCNQVITYTRIKYRFYTVKRLDPSMIFSSGTRVIALLALRAERAYDKNLPFLGDFQSSLGKVVVEPLGCG
jgi:hypothetical protein